jgi:hypothetical protein
MANQAGIGKYISYFITNLPLKQFQRSIRSREE